MSKLERTIKDLIIFYVKENYNKYLVDNNLTIIEKDAHLQEKLNNQQ